VVTVKELFRDVWPDDHRLENPAMIYPRISVIRRLLHDSGKIVVTERGSEAGYRMNVGAIDADMYTFESLVNESSTDNLDTTADRLNRALELWTDRPLLGLGGSGFVGQYIEELTTLRDLAASGLVNACRQLGRSDEAIRTINRLLAIHPDDAELRILLKQARTDAAPEPMGGRPAGSLPTIWNVPIRTAGFLPRPHVLARVREHLAAGRVVLTGLQGVGKTRLAVEYAHQFADSYDLVWWVDAERADIGDQLGQLAVRAQTIEAQAHTTARVEAAKAYLRHLGESRWLVIFDNVEDRQAIWEHIPDGNGHILLTSRSPHWMETAKPVPVDVFSRAESMQLLQQWLPDASKVEADALAERLGDLALSLAQAAGLIAMEHLSIAEYLARLPDNPPPGQDLFYRGSHSAAVRVSMQQVHATDSRAANIMRQCALLAPEVVPMSIVDPDGDGRSSLTRLSQLGLVRIYADGIQLHRLTMAAVAADLTTDERTTIREELARRVARISPHETDDAATWPQWRLLMPHLTALDPATTQVGALRDVTARAVRHLLVRGDIHAGHELARPVYAAWCERLGPDHAQTLRMATRLAMARYMTGDLEGARQLRQDTLIRQRVVLGLDHPDTLQTAQTHYLDLLMVDPAAARDLLVDTLERQRRVLGEDHTETFQSTRFLAASMHQLGQTADAATLVEASLPRQRQSLGDTHPFTLQTASDLAEYWAAIGKLAQASTLARDTLTRQHNAFGESNRDALGTAGTLARVLHRQGAHGLAASLARDTIERAQRLPSDDQLRSLIESLRDIAQ
jgi:hypothetical protein